MLAALQGMLWGGVVGEELLWAGSVSLPMPGRFSDQAGNQADMGVDALLGGCRGTAGCFVHVVNTAYLFMWLC